MKFSPKTNRVILFSAFAIIFGFMMVFTSCYPGDPLSVSQMDLVITLFDKNTDFSRFKTYVLPDTVVFLVDSTQQDEVDHSYDDFILSKVRENIERMGFVEEEHPEQNKPDAVFLIAVTNQEYRGYYGGYWDWWGWYPGWGWWGYPPGWGWYYPPYYPGGSYSFTTGTIFISMLDVKNFDEENKVMPIPWVAALNGVIEDNSANIKSRIETNIKKAFDQSEYLGAGKSH